MRIAPPPSFSRTAATDMAGAACKRHPLLAPSPDRPAGQPAPFPGSA
jgi:hypothetical protein